MANDKQKSKPKKRRDIRRRIEQFVANPRCAANVISAVRDVDMAAVVRGEGLPVPPNEQSPFAIQRGNVFEKSLFADDAEKLREALAKAGVLPEGSGGLLDLRLRRQGGPLRSNDDAVEATEAFLRACAASEDGAELPSIVAGPALRLPGRPFLPDGVIVLDVLTVHWLTEQVTLRVGEVKVYPDRGGLTDPAQLASTRAQAGIYLYGLRLTLRELGLGGRVAAADDGFLVLSRPGRSFPSVRANEDLRWQAARAEASFRLLDEIAGRLPAARPDVELDEAACLRAVGEADVAYESACAGFCPRADRCLDQALARGDAAALGDGMARLLGTTTLPRAAALLGGDAGMNQTERDLGDRLRRALPIVAVGKGA